MRSVWKVVLVAACLVVLMATLSPHNHGTQVIAEKIVLKTHPGPRPSRQLINEYSDNVGNLLLFMSIGFASGLIVKDRKHRRRIILYAAALSATVEITQALFLPARHGTFEDVVNNTLGAAVGLGLAVLARKTWSLTESRWKSWRTSSSTS